MGEGACRAGAYAGSGQYKSDRFSQAPWRGHTSRPARRGRARHVGRRGRGAPQPTVTQIQQKLNKLNTQADKLDDQFNQVQQELTSASQRLALVNKQAARYLVTFKSMRTQVAQIAAQQFENSALTTPEALLTSGDPQEILNQSSILLELSSSNRSAMRQYFAAARRLEDAQQAAHRAKTAIAALKGKLASKKQTLKKAIAQQQSLLAQLTPAQNTGLGAADHVRLGGGGRVDPAHQRGAVGWPPACLDVRARAG